LTIDAMAKKKGQGRVHEWGEGKGGVEKRKESAAYCAVGWAL